MTKQFVLTSSRRMGEVARIKLYSNMKRRNRSRRVSLRACFRSWTDNAQHFTIDHYSSLSLSYTHFEMFVLHFIFF